MVGVDWSSSFCNVDRMEVVFGDEVCEVFREAVGVAFSGLVNGKGGEALKVTHYNRSGSSVKLLRILRSHANN